MGTWLGSEKIKSGPTSNKIELSLRPAVKKGFRDGVWSL